MEHHLFLAPHIITHGLVYMVREVHLTTNNHDYLTAGMSVFLFIVQTAIAVDKFLFEKRIWEKSLRGNSQTLMAES